MSKENPNNRERYIILYADDFDHDVWAEYCSGMGISSYTTEVRINFDYSDVIELDEDDDDDDDEEYYFIDTFCEDASNIYDIHNITDAELEKWEEESGKAVWYYEINKLDADYQIIVEQWEYGTISYNDFPNVDDLEDEDLMKQFIKKNYPNCEFVDYQDY